MDMNQIGNALSGFSAGVSGNLPQWQQSMTARQTALADLDEKRQAAMAKDFRTGLMMLESGDLGSFQSLMQDRLDKLVKLGGDPTHTTNLLRMVQDGRTDEALGKLKQFEQVAVAEGLLGDMTPQYGDTITTDDGRVFKFNKSTAGYEQIDLPGGAKPAAGAGATMYSAGDRVMDNGTVIRTSRSGGPPEIYAPSGRQITDPAEREKILKQAREDEVLFAGRKAGAMEDAKLNSQLSLEPSVQAAVTKAVENVKTEVKIAGKARDNVAVFQAYDTAMRNLASALGATSTGPIVGIIPAITANAQSAEAAAKILGVAIKGLVRGAGEGTWTDNDQKQVNDMLPKRTDLPEARAAKMMFIDSFVRSKFGMPMTGGGAAPTGQPQAVAPQNPDLPTDAPPPSPTGTVRFLGFE